MTLLLVLILVACKPDPLAPERCKLAQDAWISDMQPQHVACFGDAISRECSAQVGTQRYRLACNSISGKLRVTYIRERN